MHGVFRPSTVMLHNSVKNGWRWYIRVGNSSSRFYIFFPAGHTVAEPPEVYIYYIYVLQLYAYVYRTYIYYVDEGTIAVLRTGRVYNISRDIYCMMRMRKYGSILFAASSTGENVVPIIFSSSFTTASQRKYVLDKGLLASRIKYDLQSMAVRYITDVYLLHKTMAVFKTSTRIPPPIELIIWFRWLETTCEEHRS